MRVSETHSILAPSAAHRAVSCPFSVTAERRFPETEADRDAAVEGTTAHWVLAELLRGTGHAVGTVAPTGYPIDADMIDAAMMVVEDIEIELAGTGGTPQQGAIEQSVRIPQVHEECFGTPDYFIWSAPDHLLLYDFKYGHRIVDVFENWQLIDYTNGAAHRRGAGMLDSNFDVKVKIAQPRAYHREGPIRSWEFNYFAIRGLTRMRRDAAREALSPNPRAIPGDHCRDCRARHDCEALQR
jgi:hypothetical protein